VPVREGAVEHLLSAVIAVSCEAERSRNDGYLSRRQCRYIALRASIFGRPEALAAETLRDARARGQEKFARRLTEWWRRRWGR